MNGINKVILVGTLGRDPETRYSQNGTPFCNFSVATSEKWRDKQSGEQREQTEWHNIVMIGRQAEIAQQYLHKGSKVYLEGKLKTSSWEKDGQKHYKTEVNALQMQMLDSKPKQEGYGQDYGGGRQQPQLQGIADQFGGTVQNSQDDFDDDIPF